MYEEKRPGRDSNPGRRSDSPPYWTGLYDSGFSLRSNQVSLYYPGARDPTFIKPIKTFWFYPPALLTRRCIHYCVGSIIVQGSYIDEDRLCEPECA